MFDRLANQRERRRHTGNRETHKYERTNPKGFLMRVYRNMLSRVVGIQKREAHFYEGLPILPKQVFYAWSWSDAEFWRLWEQWQSTERVQTLTPSIDRKDATKGYTLDNMQWVTQSENSRSVMPSRRWHGGPTRRSHTCDFTR